MPDSEVARTIAVVPSCSGANSFWISNVISASLSSVSLISRTEPIRRPPICTSLSFTSSVAVWRRSLYVVVLFPPNTRRATATMAIASAASAAPRATVMRPPRRGGRW